MPDVERTDQWLFLARHAGVPTRLLDWTEGALIGLHFALQENEKEPVVWMLNPLEMNRLSTPSDPANASRPKQSLVPDTLLKRYDIDPACRKSILKDLSFLGVTDSVAFPDLDGLAKELKARFLK